MRNAPPVARADRQCGDFALGLLLFGLSFDSPV